MSGFGVQIVTRPYRACVPPSTIWSATLDRGTDGDVAEAEAAIERLAAAPAEEGLAIQQIWLLRLRLEP